MPFGEKIRIKLDKRDKSSVDKFWEWTRKGAPIILEIGKRDADANNVMLKTRIKLGTPEGKEIISRDDFLATIAERIEKIQKEIEGKTQIANLPPVISDKKIKKDRKLRIEMLDKEQAEKLLIKYLSLI